MVLKNSITFGEYLSASLTFPLSTISTLSRFAENRTRDQRHMSAVIIEPTRHKHIKIKKLHVAALKLRVILASSAALLKMGVVRKVKKAPSSVSIICALESAF